MDYEQIAQVLDDILMDAAPEHREPSGGPAELPDGLLDTMRVYELSRPLKELLDSQPEFGSGRGFMVQQANGYSGFDSSGVASALVRRGLGHGADEAAAWLKRALSAEEATGLCVSIFWGVTVKDEVKLTDRLRLFPVARLPDSPQKRSVLRHSYSNGVELPVRAPSPPPEAALVTPVTVSPVIWDWSNGEPPKQHDPLEPFQLLHDVRLALALVASHPTIEGAHWFQYDDPDLQHASLYAGIGVNRLEIQPFYFHQGDAVDPSDASAVVSQLVGLQSRLKDRMRVGLERFNQALCRATPGDCAIDLSVALEALLVDNRGEHTHKVGLRAGLLRQGTRQERSECRALVSALYVLRSVLLHSGRTPHSTTVKGKGNTPAAEVVRRATGEVRHVLRRILTLGVLPDWYDLELGHE